MVGGTPKKIYLFRTDFGWLPIAKRFFGACPNVETWLDTCDTTIFHITTLPKWSGKFHDIALPMFGKWLDNLIPSHRVQCPKWIMEFGPSARTHHPWNKAIVGMIPKFYPSLRVSWWGPSTSLRWDGMLQKNGHLNLPVPWLMALIGGETLQQKDDRWGEFISCFS